jgi:cysteine-S-conjugate beta-lyase
MHYDFASLRSRHGTDSQKWQKYRGREVLPMWVADMDFHTAPEIVAALRARADEGVFGYSRPVDSTTEAVLAYLERTFAWKVEADWLVWLPGLVPGIAMACRAVGARGDGVMLNTPVYPPFFSCPKLAERTSIDTALRWSGSRWEMDWEAMERAVTPQTRLFLLCSPHNPVGRVWTRDELTRLADFCTRHDLMVCADEVHCDLQLDDGPFTAFATLSPEIAARTITLQSPSKTYNIAGLACAFAVVPDLRLRTIFRHAGFTMLGEVNNFGYVACEAAYRHGEPWRRALVNRLRANRDLLASALASGDLPGVTGTPIEATYLAWLNVEALGLTDPVAFFEEAGVGLSAGGPFGDTRYVRLNFGCPESTLREALQRMSQALKARR